MLQSLKPLLICTALGTCILFQMGCTDSADNVDAWELEGELPDTSLLPGIYQAEFEVVHDGCEPSINDVFDRVAGWPPPQIFVHYSTIDADRIVVTLPMFSWRDGQFRNAGAYTNGNFVPYTKDIWYEEWPSLLTFNYLSCSVASLYMEPYLHLRRAKVSLVAPNTVEVLITNEWGDIQECVGEDARDVFKTIPRADCSESYKTTYRLVEACILPCEPPLLGLEGGTMDGYRYLQYNPPPSCICD